MKNSFTKVSAIVLSCSFAVAAAQAGDNDAKTDAFRGPGKVFEVTITNITKKQTFTPILAVTHAPRVSLFTLGAPASEGLALMAEGGDISVLANELQSTGAVADSQTNGALLAPGASVSIRVRATRYSDRLSLAGMLIPTNDSFVALDSLDLPWGGIPVTRNLSAYDAGSEPNDELCASIPGPRCGGEGSSPSVGGEGFVHVSAGMHGIGDLSAAVYDWRNPVARIVVRRVD